MPTPLSTAHRNRLQALTSQAREAATAVCRAALENLAVHEADYRSHMSVEQRKLRNRLKARGKALGDARDERNSRQEIKRLSEDAAYEHWHRLLFTRFLAANDLLITDAANGSVPVTLDECEELASELGAKDGFDLASRFASTTLPGVFRSDDPLLDLSFPADDRKKLRDLLDAIPHEVFTASDSLGWTYQFWQTTRKKEVNDSGVKIGADELAPVTQLFTEDYMVDFLLDNSLGAWRAGKVLAVNPTLAETAQSEDELRQAVSLPGCPWKYLRFFKTQDGKWAPAAGTFDGWPKTAKELRCLDPCMGSGHFVVAMFERLVALRVVEEGLDDQAAAAAAITDNLFGLELDPRCAQIGAFNLALAAWRRVGHCALPLMNLACSGLAPNTREADWLAIAGDNEKLQRGMERLYRLFQKAAVLGSLINPRAGEGDLLMAAFHDLQPLLEQALAQEAKDHTAHEMAVTARGLSRAAEILASQFTLVATNVPYLGRGKQDDVLKDYCDRFHVRAKADLATCFVERCIDFCVASGTTVIVTPQSLLFQNDYTEVRKSLLSEGSWDIVARLGEKGFESPQAAGAFTALLGITRGQPSNSHEFMCIDVASERTPSDKAAALLVRTVNHVLQKSQLNNPDGRVTGDSIASSSQLGQLADVTEGLSTGDSDRFTRGFWEMPTVALDWSPLQSAPTGGFAGDGRTSVVFWERGDGLLKSFEGARIRGHTAWNRVGIIVGRIRNLRCDTYDMSIFEKSCVAITPHKAAHLSAIRAFTESPQFESEVKRLDQNLRASGGAFSSIPFDLTHWQKVAAKKYPDGLPKPFSRDLTQWLFSGHPADADQPLHVAVARFLGYRWPRQTGSSFPDCPALRPDGLEKCHDNDGIVCLAPLNREQPAAQRLRALLNAALGQFDERDLIRKSGPKGSTKTNLEDWLRDDFFSQHCALFHSRPSIWHIWDGLKDGFHALINYHKLDNAKLKALTYTYLGDWIRDQNAGAEAGTPGAAERLGAAKELQAKLIAILEGEAPLDLFVRWKPLHRQAIGWHPDLNDGVRLNIRPFLLAGDVGAKGAGLFRAKPGIDARPKPDRGAEPQRDKAAYPWFWCAEDPGTDPVGGKEFTGRRWNTAHFTLARKQAVRKESR